MSEEITQPGEVSETSVEEATVTAPNGDTVVAEGSTVETSSISGESTVAPVIPEGVVDSGEIAEFYEGKRIVEHLGIFDASGAEECRFEDGTTSYVPKAV